MPALFHRPLGLRIPDLPHAVSCSLPTLKDVIGYEEKDPATTQHLTSGYPRFVKHPFLKQAAEHVLRERQRGHQHFWPTASAAASAELVRWLAPLPAEAIFHRGLHGVCLPKTDEAFRQTKLFLQHTGLLPCSREAEDYLVRVGALAHASEGPPQGAPAAEITRQLLPLVEPATERDFFLAANGMNAVYGTFRALDELQRARGRRLWIQLGWLYLDTIAILQKFTTKPEEEYLLRSDVADLAGLRDLFRRHAGQIAGVITEVPTNPLIQTADLPALAELCRSEGAALVLDPSIASIGNVHVLPYADVLVTSLTKFTASEGDVIAGAAVINPTSPFAEALRPLLPRTLTPLYPREAARLAPQVSQLTAVLQQINASTPRVVEFLRQHPAVAEVFWSEQPSSAEHYRRIARHPGAVGSMVTFTLRGDLPRCYDRLLLAKGPSFGMKTSLICPFMYLAHYDLVTTPAGRAELASHGLNPELLRLSIGCEPVEEILATLREALS